MAQMGQMQKSASITYTYIAAHSVRCFLELDICYILFRIDLRTSMVGPFSVSILEYIFQ